MMTDHLLVLTHEYPPRRGGIATYVAETARAASVAGWRVTVLAPGSAELIKEPNISVRPTAVRGTQGWPDRLRMRAALRALEIDWDRTTLWLPEPGPLRLWTYARELALPTPASLVLTLHGSEVLRLTTTARHRNRFQALLARADRVGVVSRAIGTLLEERTAGAVAPDRLVEVPGAVASDLAPQLDESAPPPGGPPWTVLTVARVHPRKGQAAVVEALGELPTALRKQVEYRLIGPVRRPRYLTQLRNRAAALGVNLRGPEELASTAELALAYHQAHLMVLASQTTARSIEGLGLVYLEAAAAGCPVIATDAGGAREAIGPDNGLVVPPDDLPALTHAFENLLRDPARRAAMGAAGPKWAAAFSWETVVSRLFGAPGRGD